MWAKPFKPPTMRGMGGAGANRPQQKRQEEDEVMVIEATPSPPGSPKTASSKTASSTAPSTSPTKENELDEEDEEEDYESRKDWKPKRKLLYIDHPPPVKETLARSTQRVNAPMKPLVSREAMQERVREREAEEKATGPEGYFRVLWRKYTNKKHKTWDNDGFLVLRGGFVQLISLEGKEMGKTPCKDALLPGSGLSIGGKEVEIDSVMSKAEFMSGKCFLNNGSKAPSVMAPAPAAVPATFKTFKRPADALGSAFKRPKMKDEVDDETQAEIAPRSFYATAPQTSLKAQFKTPLKDSTVVPAPKPGFVQAKHDPLAPNALVMKRPTDCPKGKQIVDVVIDPLLANKLRPHQREGVKFLYECVMGLRDYNGQGALLADDMGLGKTLQTITLLWTLLRQNNLHKEGSVASPPIIKKALVVCPVTLIENWQREFRAWLGKERIGVLIADQKTRLTDFTHGKSYSVMIVGYERMRNIAEELDKGGGIDIVIADEGHRLKTEKNKSAQAIRSLRTERKIVLSGTPLQNDLSEFYVMVDFINPGILGNANSFKKNFENPILRSRQPGASEDHRELGEARQEELRELTGQFILRRDAEVQAQYLPAKTEIILFCQPTTTQMEIYDQILRSPACANALRGSGKAAQALSLITTLRKVCNSPRLLLPTEAKKSRAKDADDDYGQSDDVLEYISPDKLRASLLSTSTKMRVLDALLKNISEDGKEKIVIVSNFTATLNFLASHLTSLGMTHLRLDGDVPTNRRQDIVNEFNKSSPTTNFALLLSAKAGGVGLNLIGASRLVLFDVDWNPATDSQAMARVHRPGQVRPTFIYRLLMAGGMDEKIFQRQITKSGLADAIVDQKKTANAFTADELRELFEADWETGCRTHVLMKCQCGGGGVSAPFSTASRHFEDGEGEETAINIEDSPPPEEEKDDDDEDAEDSDDLPINPGFRRRRPARPLIPPGKSHISLTSASAYDWRAEEAAEAAKRAEGDMGKMDALMKYEHVDAEVFRHQRDVFGHKTREVEGAEGRVGDRMLTDVLGVQGVRVNWLFVKRSK